INLHFTGDIHAVTVAHNLLSALIDNHIYHGNLLQIDPNRILWRRVMDMSDRHLRDVTTGRGIKGDSMLHGSGFDITASSEIMAILCLSTSIRDLKDRLARIAIGYSYSGELLYARDFCAAGAMAVVLKDAIKPNLVQTLEGQPAFVHGGPFANIAHGNNSVSATRLALKLADYVVTEGGFAADLGAEKFFDIVHPATGIQPGVAILVVSARALKSHGGVAKSKVNAENVAAVRAGFPNMEKHLDNLRNVYKLPVVVAVNRFPNDTDAELRCVLERCKMMDVPAAISDVVAQGGKGGIDVAKEVVEAAARPNGFGPLYAPELPLTEKIERIVTTVYGGDGVKYTPEAQDALERLTAAGYGRLPVCIAKTQMSFSDDPHLRGAPTGWTLTIREVRLMAGAGFVTAIAGAMMTMPGLPEVPSSGHIDLLDDGTVSGVV
ncbi:MAG: formate--tetrahydrofolate ligase, partial [Capsulimonadaceae bacterium]